VPKKINVQGLLLGILKVSDPETQLLSCRFSQKTNEQICFSILTTAQDRKNKFVRSFFGRIFGSSILLGDLLTFGILKLLFLTLFCVFSIYFFLSYIYNLSNLYHYLEWKNQQIKTKRGFRKEAVEASLCHFFEN
jgi:hypothetical protein